MKSIRSMVLVSSDPASVQQGAREVYSRLQEEIRAAGLAEEVALNTICGTGGPGRVDLPLVIIYPEAVVYAPVQPEVVPTLVEEHLVKGQIGKNLLSRLREPSGELAWLRRRQGTMPAEKRIVLEHAGVINPESLEDYIQYDGYQGLGRALCEMTPAQVVTEVEKSGLQGRGGAGFPAGRKWSFVVQAPGLTKYVVCNADESEPGTFKDRVILESDPFSILEAMSIAGYAVGAAEGYIYIRGEYRLAYKLLENAIRQASAHGLLGDNILGTGFHFHIHLHAGAGAYVCGEETALIESLEGKRGQPRARPPYPPTYGIWGKPTQVNNVETLANIPAILRNGYDWYHQYGTAKSVGTKIFAISGNTSATGLIEAPFGITLREVIEIYGKGMKNGAKLKLVQTGGSSGSIIPASFLDTPLDYESFRAVGATLGSGALLVCDERTCVVDLAKTLLQFFRFESCSKCTPCRVGTEQAYEIVSRIAEGQGAPDDLETLIKIGVDLEQISNCGLGQAAIVPIRDILKYFRAEVEAHIQDRVCPAGVCPVAQPAPQEALVRQAAPA